MNSNIVRALREVAGPPFVPAKRYITRVNIDLAYYNGRVPYEKRTNRHFLNVLVPQVLDDLNKAISTQFKIINHHHSVYNLRTTCTFELEGGSVVTAITFDSRVLLEAFADTQGQGEHLRTLLHDFKLEKNYGGDVGALSQSLQVGERDERKKVVKLMVEIPDPRFIPSLMTALNDRSPIVRQEAIKALGLIKQQGHEVDLSKGSTDKDEDVRILTQAFLFGNEFTPGTQITFLREEGKILPEEKIAGVLMGGAVGDMLGYPIEFRTREEIRRLYGGPTSDLVLSKSRTIDFGQFSDDTEMTLLMTFAIEGKFGFNPGRFAQYLAEHVYQMDTQGIPNHGYGINTLRAARRLYTGVRFEQSGLNYSTCSPTIRIAPLGLYFHEDIENLERAVIAASIITHNNKIAIAGALAVALSVAKLVNMSGEFKSVSLLEWLRARQVKLYDAQLLKKIELAARLAADPSVSDEYAYNEIGNSSQTREVVPLAFYAFFRSPYDYKQTVLRAVNAGGDADSAGSIAGSLSGALNGISAIPQKWVNHLKDSFLVYKAIHYLSSIV